MSGKIHLEIVTPDKNFYEGDVRMFVIETTEGEIAILNDHEPLVTPVVSGHIWINKENKSSAKDAFCSKGFLTFNDNTATIVVDAAEWKEDIDVNRAEEAKKRAQKKLDNRTDEVDVIRAKTAVKRAINRIRVSKM